MRLVTDQAEQEPAGVLHVGGRAYRTFIASSSLVATAFKDIRVIGVGSAANGCIALPSAFGS